MRTFIFASLASLGLVAACNPYDPDLGPTPFRCGTSEPRCPDGYTCVEHSPAEQICESGVATVDGGDDTDGGGDITCNDDSSIEPNDSTSSAWVTPIPSTMPSVSLVQLAICPTTDKDLFRFGVEVNGKNMKATVTTDVASGPLLLQVLNGAATIANGQATSQTEIVVAVNNLAVGSYYVQVAANGAGVENNYTIDIVTCDGAPCP